MSIGENIRYYRKKKGLTQKKLAELTGLAEITIRQYESCKYEPKTENLLKIRKALDVNINQLYGTMEDIDLIDYGKLSNNMVPYNKVAMIPKNLPINKDTIKLLKALDKFEEENPSEKLFSNQVDNMSEENEKYINKLKGAVSMSTFIQEVEEKSWEDYLSLLYSVGYEITKLDEGIYEMVGKNGRVIVTEDDLEALQFKIMDFVSYTADKFYEQKRNDGFEIK